ncbi:DUF1569 domain-containing protein [Lacinutrix neustonica]|uniref:DUF1569 domain-containing protein n=1 Tax=Lacinutrix neustonica TaxID=2980107 RepID=A0A9E8SIE7_9FLAO|nr:DUF1569 domain-containing protein [Lacinutrix neustonica]WAC03605.1 DUF1569 domain-containing protein [Lacinutrix neustonica]
MQSIFNPETHQEILNRVDNLNENLQPNWGKMTVGQMLAHCQIPLNVILEKEDYGLKPNWLINLLFKKSMYNDKPWRKNMPTPKRFQVIETKDFNTEKQKLVTLLNELHEHKEKTNWQPHPAFGKLTKDQWGQMQYKHLNHHLTQFGV